MKKGFTLIELMVVISIIAILSSIGFATYSGLNKKTRDSRRMVDLEVIRQALELYRSDNGTYPVSSWEGSGVVADWVAALDLVPDFASQIPVDSRNSGSEIEPCIEPTKYRYNYRSNSSGQGYILTAIMEDASSNAGSECQNLSNWEADECDPDFTTDDVCYGVQNP